MYTGKTGTWESWEGDWTSPGSRQIGPGPLDACSSKWKKSMSKPATNPQLNSMCEIDAPVRSKPQTLKTKLRIRQHYKFKLAAVAMQQRGCVGTFS